MTSDLSAEKKIDVLLAEYGTLRAEILERNTILNQFIAAGAALAVPLIGLGVEFKAWWAVGAMAAAMLLAEFLTWIIVHANTRELTTRLLYLETEINRRVGEPLLAWETTRPARYHSN